MGVYYFYIKCIDLHRFSTSEHQIVKYISPIGNSDVPYPYAYDNIGNFYIMLDMIKINAVPERFINDNIDPYPYYYGYDEWNCKVEYEDLFNIKLDY